MYTIAVHIYRLRGVPLWWSTFEVSFLRHFTYVSMSYGISHQTWHIYTMFDQCWPTVYDVGPPLFKHWVSVLCYVVSSVACSLQIDKPVTLSGWFRAQDSAPSLSDPSVLHSHKFQADSIKPGLICPWGVRVVTGWPHLSTRTPAPCLTPGDVYINPGSLLNIRLIMCCGVMAVWTRSGNVLRPGDCMSATRNHRDLAPHSSSY